MIADNDINLSFIIRGYEDISHIDISTSLDLIPHKIYIKGEKINENNAIKAKNNGWVYGTPYGNPNSFEEQMNRMLDTLEPKIPILKEYAEKYDCEFSCAIFFLNEKVEDISIQFNDRYNAFIKEVDVEFDFDIYYPPFLDECDIIYEEDN